MVVELGTSNHAIVRRAGWALVDQAVSSASNLLVVVLVARSTDAAGFGAFALAYGAYVVILGITAAVSSEPLIIRHSATDDRRVAVRRATGAAVVVGLLGGVASLLIGLAIGGSTGATLQVLALVLPGLTLQDCLRFALFGAGQARSAAINDAVWLCCQGLGFWVLLSAVAEPTAPQFVLVWGAGAAIAAVVGACQASTSPELSAVGQWLSLHRTLIPGLLTDFLLMTGALQLIIVLVALVADLSAAGGLRAAQTLLGPLSVLLMAARTFALSEAARLRAAEERSLVAAAWVLAAGLALVSVLSGAAASQIPSSIGSALLGDSWEGARQIVPAMTLVMAARAASIPAMVGLRVLDCPRRILVARFESTPLLLLGAVLGALSGSGEGAAYGLAVAQVVTTVIWWWHFVVADRSAAGPRPGAAASISPLQTPMSS